MNNSNQPATNVLAKNILQYIQMIFLFVIIIGMIIYAPYFVLAYACFYDIFLCFKNKKVISITKAVPYMGGVLRRAALGSVKDVDDYRKDDTYELGFIEEWPKLGQEIYLALTLAVSTVYIGYTYFFFVKGTITTDMDLDDIKKLNPID